MKQLSNQLHLNQIPVIIQGKSIYGIADEDTVDEFYVAFESFLEGEPIESIISLQLIYLKALSAYFNGVDATWDEVGTEITSFYKKDVIQSARINSNGGRRSMI